MLTFLVLAMLTVAPAHGQDLWVSILAPKDGAIVIGDLEIVADVVSVAAVKEVEFQLDGRPVGTVTMEPYRMHVDLGSKNTSHRISVVARDENGNEATNSVTTQPVPVAADFEVELQQLYVTVTRDGKQALDLEREAFSVTDDGDPQDIITFARGDIPFTAVLLIDASASMYGEKIEAAVEGAASFVHGMNELDQAQVMVFSDQLLSTTPITGAKAVLTAGLGGTEARGGTALQDHLFVSLMLLERRQGRRVIVLLSDGVDTHSVLSMHEVSEIARKSSAMVYWIRFSRTGDGSQESGRVSLSSAWKDQELYQEQQVTLSEVVNRSGGRIFNVTSPDQIRSVFLRVLNELREQYVLGYYPSNKRNDDRWHRVKVKVDGDDVSVRAPRGYVDH
jgi:Ca-activated chloride channel family protein